MQDYPMSRRNKSYITHQQYNHVTVAHGETIVKADTTFLPHSLSLCGAEPVNTEDTFLDQVLMDQWLSKKPRLVIGKNIH